jgi:peptidoglycan hydrolase CwlO-like protein
MGKVFLYASIAVTLATTALGFINKNKLSDTKGELASSEKTVKDKTAVIEQAQKDIKAGKEKLETVTAEKDQVAAQAETLKTDLEKNKKDAADLKTQIDAKTTEVAKLAADLEEAKKKVDANTGAVPPAGGMSAEDQAKMQEKETLITKLQGDLDASRTQLEGLRKEKIDRTLLKMRNGLEGRILAVNQAWNFVVLNLGDKNGVVGNAEMLIKRGSQLVGKVRVTSVEPSTSIADIVANSVPRGVSIQPGDNVIYQATAE